MCWFGRHKWVEVDRSFYTRTVTGQSGAERSWLETIVTYQCIKCPDKVKQVTLTGKVTGVMDPIKKEFPKQF